MVIKIASLNLCLGLSSKKNLVKELILCENVELLCLQETEISPELDVNLISFPGFAYESETNSIKSRVGCFIKNNINYKRCYELEGVNAHLIIIDIKAERNLRIINIYRTFSPQGGVGARAMFTYQLDLIKNAFTNNTILLGDLNLDWSKKGMRNYPFDHYFEEMDDTLSQLNVVQLVNFPTWSRFIREVHRESILDHVYTNCPTSIVNLHSVAPHFGDHMLIKFDHSCSNKTVESKSFRRNWKGYSKEKACLMLSSINWDITDDSVQGFWNSFENKLITAVDVLVPMTEFSNTQSKKSILPPTLKNKFNIRKRLLKRMKLGKTLELKQRIKVIDDELKFFYHKNRSKNIRKIIKPGNSKSLWSAVKCAKDLNHGSLPTTMLEGGEEILEENLSDRFACYFDKKIKNVVSQIELDENVFNGNKKLECQDLNFMDTPAILSCIKSLKNKNSEGFDRIPQRIIVDGADVLINPLTEMFKRIYFQRTVPDQWLISKTIPVYKNKGDAKSIENYRPIANLCSASKIFEKLILKRINEIQEENNCDITGSNQHGFKKGKSTATISLTLQSQIARALDENKFVLMSSLDLSAAFDVVNIELLIKRLKIAGFPMDVIDLIKVWLEKRFYYVSINGENSTLYNLLLGTVQGSILGPTLYAIFVAPLFDIVYLEGFADDMFIPREGSILTTLVHDMEDSLDSISKWYSQSGLVVNQSKTEICLFYKTDIESVEVTVGTERIKTLKEMNVLGVTFDSKMQWNSHVCKCLKKANKSLCALKLISRYFNTGELLQILTSNVFSILYYNSEVWHLPSLNQSLHKKLLTFSSTAIKMAFHYPRYLISYNNLHKMAKRATPEMFCKYKLSLLLHKLYNDSFPANEWLHLNFDQIMTTRQHNFEVSRNYNYRVGLNAMVNRLQTLNGQIPLTWLNKSFVQYKLECKKKFLS